MRPSGVVVHAPSLGQRVEKLAVEAGLTSFPGDVLQDLLLQRQLRHQPLKLRVLLLQLLEPFGLLELEPAVFLAPPVVGLLGDLALAAGLRAVLPVAIVTSTCLGSSCDGHSSAARRSSTIPYSASTTRRDLLTNPHVMRCKC